MVLICYLVERLVLATKALRFLRVDIRFTIAFFFAPQTQARCGRLNCSMLLLETKQRYLIAVVAQTSRTLTAHTQRL